METRPTSARRYSRRRLRGRPSLGWRWRQVWAGVVGVSTRVGPVCGGASAASEGGEAGGSQNPEDPDTDGGAAEGVGAGMWEGKGQKDKRGGQMKAMQEEEGA